MTSPKVPEHLIQNQILDYLKVKGCYVWRNNTGAFVRNYYSMKEAKWKETFFRSGQKGLPDILGVAPDGKLIAIEVKTATGKVSPEQKETLAEMANRGAWAFVARSLDDVIKAFHFERSILL